MMELNADQFITEREYQKLIDTVYLDGTRAAQVDYVLYQLLWLTGMRISACLSLEWDEVHDGYLIVKAEYSKNGKKNTVVLGRRAQRLLADFRSTTPYKMGPYIFQSQKGRINRSSAHRRLKQWLAKAGVRDSIHLHSFRHSFAVNALNAGVALPMIKQQLQHENISTTSTYLGFTEDNLNKLKDVM